MIGVKSGAGLAPQQIISGASGAVIPKIAPAGDIDILPGPRGAWPTKSTFGLARLVHRATFVPIRPMVQELGVQTSPGPHDGLGSNLRPAVQATGAIAPGSKSWCPLPSNHPPTLLEGAPAPPKGTSGGCTFFCSSFA